MQSNEINDRIRLIMNALELNNYSFAKKLGVSQTVIYNIADLKGRQSKPSYDLLTKILKVTNADPSWLLLGDTNLSVDTLSSPQAKYPTNDGYLTGRGLLSTTKGTEKKDTPRSKDDAHLNAHLNAHPITSSPPNVGQNDIIFSQEGGDGPKRDEKFTSDEKNKYYRANNSKVDILEEENTVYQTNEDTMSTPDQNLQMIIELQRQLIAEKESHLQDMREMMIRYERLIDRAFDESDDSDESGENSLGDIALAS